MGNEVRQQRELLRRQLHGFTASLDLVTSDIYFYITEPVNLGTCRLR
jgi:hypothetical protein